MRFKFSANSTQNYVHLTLKLQKIAKRVLNYGIMDFAITDSYRSKARQDRAFKLKKSKVCWPMSKHNCLPSRAMDLVPFINGRLSWNKIHCSLLAGMVLATGREMGVVLRWGGNWDMDSEPVTDQDFQDLAHFEEAD